jgi:hypothetical protein
MEEDKLDRVLTEVCSTNNGNIKGINDITVPEFNDVFSKFQNTINTNVNSNSTVRKGSGYRYGWIRAGAAAACILIFSYIFAMFTDTPKVHAFRFNLIKTFVQIKDDIIHINSSKSYSSGSSNSISKNMTLEEARKELPCSIPVPDYIPADFKFSNVEYKKFQDGTYTITQTYSGMANKYITIITTLPDSDNEVNQDVYDASKNKVSNITIMGEEGTLVSSANLNMAIWYKNGFKSQIIGTVSESEFMKLLDSLK